MKTLLSLIIVSGALASVSLAQTTLGHWRFEDDLNDSSGNGNTLIAANGAATQPLLTMGGGAFPTTFGGQANTSMGATFGDNVFQLEDADDLNFGSSSFTFEAIVSPDDKQFTEVAGQWGDLGNRSWRLYYNAESSQSGSGRMGMNLFDSSSTLVKFHWTPSGTDGFEVGGNYYVAVVVSPELGNVTFYYQDLDADEGLLSASKNEGAGFSLFNSTADFTIGTSSAGNAASYTDEVRLTSGALSQSQLLVSVVAIPEPSAYGLMFATVLLFGAFLRRRPRALSN